jgi:hypothetical protein
MPLTGGDDDALHLPSGSGYRNKGWDFYEVLTFSCAKELSAAFRKFLVCCSLLFKLCLDQRIWLVSRQALELARVLKVFGKSLHGRACRPSEFIAVVKAVAHQDARGRTIPG